MGLLADTASRDVALKEPNLREMTTERPYSVDYSLEEKGVNPQQQVIKDRGGQTRSNRKRALTIEELLNPVDGKMKPNGLGEASSPTSIAGTLKKITEGDMKPRVMTDIRRRTRGPGKRKIKQYAVMRMRL
ncbi:MAG: hypothetical protein Q9219_005781 [cf. Caloplaca sp. 3 TL-2023]